MQQPHNRPVEGTQPAPALRRADQRVEPDARQRPQAERLSHAAALVRQVVRNVSTVVVGKELQVRQCLACLLAGGHVLIEDLPGVGKTTLAHALAMALGLKFTRVQFTSDLLPTDVLGTPIYDRAAQQFVFHAGPIFTEVLLADEINRAGPKTQSALLEAMEERQVTSDGVTRPLPKHFFVIATQNPFHQLGTSPLPESQLDRFLMCIELGYPTEDGEKSMLMGINPRRRLGEIQAGLREGELTWLASCVDAIHVSQALADYLYRIIRRTRDDRNFAEGLSPRAGLAALQAARAWALMQGRSAVMPDDVQSVLSPIALHRLRRRLANGGTDRPTAAAFAEWLAAVPVEAPTDALR